MGVKEYRRHSAAITRTPRWKALRQEVLRRDGWKCVQCGARGRLEIDHKKPVRDFPELAWALDNLQALCPRCHGAKTIVECGLATISPERQKWRDAIKKMEKNRGFNG